ncbi:hypothetical protein TKK_0018078 [Trichogramma kaykai]|uniref:Uncharacterized protein n=1 Tax=Trichogramma kaykai TaxID=54128 RepID=A0ABD2W0C1_9HYME
MGRSKKKKSQGSKERIMRDVSRFLEERLNRRKHKHRPRLTSESSGNDSSVRSSSDSESSSRSSSPRDSRKRRRSGSRSPRSRSSRSKRRRRSASPVYSSRGSSVNEDEKQDGIRKSPVDPPVPKDADKQVRETAKPVDTVAASTNQSPAREEQLNDEVLNILGQPIVEERVLAEPVHSTLASRWLEVLKLGLPKEERTELLKKYPPPKNCVFLDAPKLNNKIGLSLNESCRKRDERIVFKHSKLQASMAAIAKALTPLLDKKDDETVPIMECLSHASRLIIDTMHDEIEIRRSLVLANINSSVKDALASSKPDEAYLFGGNLSEALKQAQATGKDVQVLSKKSTGPSSQASKNGKGPARQSNRSNAASTYGQQRSVPKSQHEQRSHRSFQSRQRQRSTQKSFYDKSYARKR